MPISTDTSSTGRRKLNIVFVHPDLGIGGAERLIIDAAVGLQELGHTVTILTSHCDRRHCFEEARDGTLDVRVRGGSPIPASVRGRLKIVCAIGRQAQLVAETCVFSDELAAELRPDVLVADQLSACVPLFRLLLRTGSRRRRRPPLLFYCHYPDKLLAPQPSSSWPFATAALARRLYRLPFDALESWSTGASDAIVVNSRFTRSVFLAAFPRLAAAGWDPAVVYPCVDVRPPPPTNPASLAELIPALARRPGPPRLILSLNRFERKKRVEAALAAFAALAPAERTGAVLVLAGGYDGRVAENVEYHAELVQAAAAAGFATVTLGPGPDAWARRPASGDGGGAEQPAPQVVFLLSIPSALKFSLLGQARLLAYTPAGEHFGIVPLEAMLARVPVLADDSGGPRETIVDAGSIVGNGSGPPATGWLRDAADVQKWAQVFSFALDERNKERLEEMGRNGHDRVVRLFSKEQMAARFETVLVEMLDNSQNRPLPTSRAALLGLFLLPMAIIILILALLVRIYLKRLGLPV